MTLFIGALLTIVALILGSREWRLYRAQRDGTWNEGTDLFAYTKGRFWVRGAGLVSTAGLGVGFCLWELSPPRSPEKLGGYVAVLGLCSVILLLSLISDLVITAKTARPGDIRRQGAREDPDR